jgi:uncharacterized protein YjdB
VIGITKEEIMQKISQQQEQNQLVVNDVAVRHIEPSMQTRVTALIIDRKYSLTVELKDDSKDNSYEAIGLPTYSNSKLTELTYTSIFESLHRNTLENLALSFWCHLRWR